MTIQEQFDSYIEAVYDDAPLKDSEQYKQLRDAFFGGTLIALGFIDTDAYATELAEHISSKLGDIKLKR